MREYKSPVFSQKHYETLAWEIRVRPMGIERRKTMVEQLSLIFASDSKKFDKIRFEKMCLGEE
jgi:hypothetical protein